MDRNFVLKGGKFAGKTIGWLQENEPNYLAWAKKNAPNLLKAYEPKVKQIPPVDKKKIVPDYREEAMKPNTNFYNEPPDEISLAYINKTKAILPESIIKPTKTENDEWNF